MALEYISPQLYAVIGKPVAHSLSPALHSTAFRILGIPAILVPWELETEELARFVDAMRFLEIQGAAVTIPHKEDVVPLLDEVSDRARAVGAVNLIFRRNGRLLGDNTDVPGFTAPLENDPPAPGARALVLGSGGAARAVIAGLREIGFTDILLSNPNPPSALRLADEFALTYVPWEERLAVRPGLVVNTTPLGMLGQLENETPFPAAGFAGLDGVAYDIVYTPFKTRFLREAENAGWRTIGGLDMFLAQANRQFLVWTGKPIPEEANRYVVDILTARLAR